MEGLAAVDQGMSLGEVTPGWRSEWGGEMVRCVPWGRAGFPAEADALRWNNKEARFLKGEY